MFTALEVRKQIAAALDAENSDHYRDDLDYIPAINSSIKWLTNVVNMAMSQNKISEEFFRDITYAGVFQTDSNSRISLQVFPSEVWSILAIYPLPEVEVNRNVPALIADDPTRSYYRSDRTHLRADNDCKRLSLEEWARTRGNPMEAGYEGTAVCGELKQYAYLNPINYFNFNTGIRSELIEIRPRLNMQFATVFYAKKPVAVATINDNIEFPNSVFQLIVMKALNYISFKQGDGTTIYEVSDRDVQQLIQAITL